MLKLIPGPKGIYQHWQSLSFLLPFFIKYFEQFLIALSNHLIIKEEDDLIPNDDIPSRLIILLENKADNWDMRRRNKILAMMTGGRESVTALKSEVRMRMFVLPFYLLVNLINFCQFAIDK